MKSMDKEELLLQDHLLDLPVVRRVLDQVWLQDGETQLQSGWLVVAKLTSQASQYHYYFWLTL